VKAFGGAVMPGPLPAGRRLPRCEVTFGGVDTKALDSKTLQARAVKGLYFIANWWCHGGWEAIIFSGLVVGWCRRKQLTSGVILDLLTHMTQGRITAGRGNGWTMMDGVPQLTKRQPPSRLVGLILRPPSPAWKRKSPLLEVGKGFQRENSKIEPDPATGMPGGWGLSQIAGLTLLMGTTKTGQLFARMGG